jgi:hypothetical protein
LLKPLDEVWVRRERRLDGGSMAAGWRFDGGWMAATAPSTTLGVVCRDVLQRACGGGGGLRITAGFEQLHERVDAASVSNSHLILGAQA